MVLQYGAMQENSSAQSKCLLRETDPQAPRRTHPQGDMLTASRAARRICELDSPVLPVLDPKDRRTKLSHNLEHDGALPTSTGNTGRSLPSAARKVLRLLASSSR